VEGHYAQGSRCVAHSAAIRLCRRSDAAAGEAAEFLLRVKRLLAVAGQCRGLIWTVRLAASQGPQFFHALSDTAMNLVQLFLPLYDNQGRPFQKARFDRVREELAQEFGGVTAYVRSPAVGVWENDDGAVSRDDVVLFEVMVETVDRAWWTGYRQTLEREFAQESILIRVTKAEVI
jgi:hypothetical protein